MKVKKMAFVLAVSALLALGLSTIAFAEITAGEDGKTLSGYGTLSDDFNYNITSETVVQNYPYLDTAKYNKNNFLLSAGANNNTMWLVPQKGFDGSTAMKLQPSPQGNYIQVCSKHISFYEDSLPIDGMIAVCSYDMQLGGITSGTYDNATCARIGIGHQFNIDSGTLFKIKTDENGGFYFESNANTADVLNTSPEDWFTITLVQMQDKRQGYIADKKTGEILLTASKSIAPDTATPRQRFNIFSMNGASNGFTAYIDNLSINIYNENDTVSLTEKSIEDGATEINRNTSVSLSFSKNVDASKIKVRDSSGELVSGYEVKNAGWFGKKIVFTKLLDKNATYTVDLSEIGEESFSFTTKSGYILGAEFTSKFVSADKKSVTVSYKLSDSENIKKITGRAMAILYEDGKMAGADFVTLTDVNVGETLSTTFSFSKEIGDNSSISLIFFENGKWIPMTGATVCK